MATSANLYHSILEQLHPIYIVLNKELEILALSKACKTAWQTWKIGESIVRHVENPDIHQNSIPEGQQELRTKDPRAVIVGEWKNIEDGAWIFLSKQGNLQPREGGQSNLNSTEEKIELELLKQLAIKSTEGIQIVDEIGNILYMNEISADHFGIPHDKYWQKKAYEIDPKIRNVEEWVEHVNRLKEVDHLTLRAKGPSSESSAVNLELKMYSLYQGDKVFIVTKSKYAGASEHVKTRLNNEGQLEDILVDIASTYINLDFKDLDNAIRNSLEQMGRFVNADRAYLFSYNLNKQLCDNTHEWCNTGIKPEIDNLQGVPLKYIPQWVEEHRKGHAFYVPDVYALKDSDPGLYAILISQEIKSLIAVPIFNGVKLEGFVGFDSVREHYLYSEKEQNLLSLFGHMIMNVKTRFTWEKALRKKEEKFRNIIDGMNLGMLELDLKGKILHANPTFCNMSGYSLDELHGREAIEIYVLEKNNKDASRNKLIEANSLQNLKVDAVSKSGIKRTWLLNKSPYYNDRGDLTGSICIHIDLSAAGENILRTAI